MWRYLDTAGYQLDCLLNALAGGMENQTISRRAALAKRDGSRVGCVLCRWLSWTVERHHCARQLAGQPERRWAAMAAGLELLAVAAALWGISVWLVR